MKSDDELDNKRMAIETVAEVLIIRGVPDGAAEIAAKGFPSFVAKRYVKLGKNRNRDIQMMERYVDIVLKALDDRSIVAQ